MKVKLLLLIVLTSMLLAGCNTKKDNFKDDTKKTEEVKNLNDIKQEPDTSSKVKDLDSITAENTGNADEITGVPEVIEVQPELRVVTLSDGTTITVTEETADAIIAYEAAELAARAKDYPQEKEVRANTDANYETTINASFTVNEIKYIKTLYDDKGQGVLTARVRGIIAGLDGVYELEIPYEKAVKLKETDTFAITYQTVRIDNNIVITNIKY